ncbi:MAG: hypothetical protein A4E71_02930 [Smithella sp. PtaU1.Bin162]|nr:MAG: hypothetical protein A4E71_02930 [Smithella sp. PtaU1.Bin162]
MNEEKAAKKATPDTTIDDLISTVWMAGRNCDREMYDDAGDEINRRFAILREKVNAIEEVCSWKIDDDGFWMTSCGNAHCFIEGNIRQNKYKYCPYCGQAIKAVKG